MDNDMSSNANRVNWDTEIVALQDLTMTAFESHRIVAELLLASMNASDPLRQKILTAKLAAEMVSALEDLGGLAWSIRSRSDHGILDRYIKHEPKTAREIFQSIRDGKRLRELLNLPDPSLIATKLSVDDLDALDRGLDGLERSFEAAAATYCNEKVNIVRAYNKLKHGFIVIVRLDKLKPGENPPGDWKNDVNILTGFAANGAVKYTALERTSGSLEGFMGVVNMCADTAKELAYLLMFLWERNVSLDMSDAPRGGSAGRRPAGRPDRSAR